VSLLARDGTRRRASELADRAPLEEALGTTRITALELDDVLLDPRDHPLADALGLTLLSPAALIAARVWPRITFGATLAEQQAPPSTREDLLAIALLIDRPLAIDRHERVVDRPLRRASDAARKLIAELPLADQLADAAWSEMAPAHMLAPLEPRRIAEALRAAFPEETPRGTFDLDALYEWLREAGEAIAADENARGALAGAAVLPSQRGTLRAARDLVLDPELPDLGLGWGLAADAPPDVARWLRATFELDRRAREAITAHVLDGLDEAASREDRPRAARLIDFLAGALGAGEISSALLEERARRDNIRARLKVPVEGGAWTKPRFAWSPTDRVAAHAEVFVRDLPPRIALEEISAPGRLLLAACGARSDLDQATIEACLTGERLREGVAARVALARYVAERALTSPANKTKHKLASRAWVPTANGKLAKPSALLWPDALARALFAGDDERFPDPAFAIDLPDDAGERLGFARAAALSLADIAASLETREALPPLLDFIERSITDGRFDAKDVGRTLGEHLALRDDAGALRAPRELAETGARALFGAWRGDLAPARPRLMRALGIPARPTAAMIADYMREAGERLDTLADDDREMLAVHLPLCLAELAELDDDRKLPEGAAIAGASGERVLIVRVGDPRLRMASPEALAELVDPSLFVDPLPAARDDELTRRLLASGIPDLWSAFEASEVVLGPRREDLDADAEALRERLAVGLGGAIGSRARAVESLSLRGVLRLASGEGYRGGSPIAATISVDAAIDRGAVWMTPDVIADPTLLAPALARDPVRRAGLLRWLAEGAWAEPPRAPREKRAEPAPSESESGGIFTRIKRFFAPDASPTEKPKRAEDTTARVGERFFTPSSELGPQLGGREDYLDDRRRAPDFGFAFAPPRLAPPWVYAPKLIATRFHRGAQRWEQARLERPGARAEHSLLSMQGRLPKGEAILPIPHYGRLTEMRAEGAVVLTGSNGAAVVHLRAASDVRLEIVLERLPDFSRAIATNADALDRFVPDGDLPDEVHDFLGELDGSAFERAIAVRDFIRARYRYDPSYLEDAAVGRWLARVTHGRANVHVAALHSARDDKHLGAGVCYELNTLACELLRRAGVPSAIATGWVLSGGALSEPDHLWAIALLQDARGAPLWLPIDASTTRDGRPLRVPARPPGRFRTPRTHRANAPPAPDWERSIDRPRRSKKKKPPLAELGRVLRYLAQLSGEELDPELRADIARALEDPSLAKRLLERLAKR
jgi:transglutaminase-like putative cysteine protease